MRKKNPTKEKVKKKNGRPFSNPVAHIGVNEIRTLAHLGATNDDISQIFGISTGCFKEFIKRNPKLLVSLKNEKDKADNEVEASLYLQAIGYTTVETRTSYNSQLDKWVSIDVRVQVKPNITAIIFWLKNRQPEKWRDLQEFAGKFQHDMEVKQAQPEEITDEHRKRVENNMRVIQRYGEVGSLFGKN